MNILCACDNSVRDAFQNLSDTFNNTLKFKAIELRCKTGLPELYGNILLATEEKMTAVFSRAEIRRMAQRIPILFVTHNSDESVKLDWLKQGILDCIYVDDINKVSVYRMLKIASNFVTNEAKLDQAYAYMLKIDAAPVIFIDKKTLKIMLANPLACKLFGKGYKELVGTDLRTYFPQDLSRILRDSIQGFHGRTPGNLGDWNGFKSKQDEITLQIHAVEALHNGVQGVALLLRVKEIQ